MKRRLALFLITISILGCTKEGSTIREAESNAVSSYSGKFIRDYFSLLCKIVQTTPGFFPPQASRAYGYVGLAAYESVIYGISAEHSLAGQLNGLEKLNYPIASLSFNYNWALSSNAATADMMRRMFEKKISANNLASIDSMENANYHKLAENSDAELTMRSVKLGRDISAALFEYSKSDGGHESYLDPFQLPYTPPIGDDKWVPTGALTTPVSPYWGNNRPMMQRNIDQTQNYVFTPFSNAIGSDFYNDALKVYNQVKLHNTPEQITIAKYWADDPFSTCTPTGHSYNIMSQLLTENNASLLKTVVAYAQLGIAEIDAFIACFKTKYQSCLVRPVTYIRKYIDPAFTPIIGTPAFPSFSSGHSYEIGAASRIMVHLFTDGSGDYNYTDYSQLQYGFNARSFTNFNTMAIECADSRFYAGIHFIFDNSCGIGGGRTIGNNVSKHFNWPVNIR